jgi:hypothetical protein
MRRTTSMFASAMAVSIICGASLAVAENASAPPLVQQINNGNWLDAKEAEALRDELYYQRAIFAYQTMLRFRAKRRFMLSSVGCWTLRPRTPISRK